MRRAASCLFLVVAVVEDTLWLAFAAAVGELDQRVLRHELDRELEAEVGMQPLLDMLLETIPAAGIVANLDFHRHLVPHNTITDIALGDAQPLAGGARIALDCGQAGLRPDAHTADAHHGVASPEHLLHPAE